MGEVDNLPPATEVIRRAEEILDAHWRPEGYCVPNATVYPFRWLWDSCFHAVVWAHLGRGDRAREEIAHVFHQQDDLGFIPHIDYSRDPTMHASFWGRAGASSITQPPMYGHAIAELVRCGVDVPDEIVHKARLGLEFLLRHRRRDPATGLVTVVHPWETGADNSPRWDHWCAPTFDLDRWFDVKGSLLHTVERSPSGAPIANPAFGAAPVGFNALLAFNGIELAAILGDDAAVVASARDLVAPLAARWDDVPATWVDGGAAARGSGRAATLDALLPVLVLDDDHAGEAAAQLIDPAAHGATYGPTGVRRDDPTFAPDEYWRGSAWPQLTYLHWVAARRRGDVRLAADLGSSLVTGATRSGYAEHWHPDDAAPLGARPQSWTALAAVVSSAAEGAPGGR